ncbi:ABC transporter permease [Brevibacillus borstelensis]|jgi:ABC-2 type transport system permease protein|uniref:ABC transporter permease n=1 Tax=Brevibacillus borstelensis TaxID=45462 RepID=UPI00148FCE26|nr:ABC transporter permease [Brevibacillus borstelensis]MBE5395791.1 ABC transporter permease [Brevibacillus borstelensis]MED1744252.1 ABC transporter permease [Brevibacillus borstelensis]MED1850865.1 ABC transporter permease [Brevibacillus borstelensis]MED1874418.1 ABC transporter permease [Brevibacillus borstelensis]NOU53480.1 ABC transporter permease [Brevibacillus borstelensis]
MSRFSPARYWSVVKKEIIQVKRDRPSLAIALAMPLMMLFLFGYAVNTDVSDIKTAVWDQSPSAYSRELVSQLENTRVFQVVAHAGSYSEIEAMLDDGSASVALVIPPDYARKRDRGEMAEVQMLIDGSDPNIARTASSNAQLIVQNNAITIQEERMQKQGLGPMEPAVELDTRVLFNPNMESIVFNIPGLIGLIMQNVTMILTAFSLVREKERGTMEQLIVTPIRPLELLLGKITPYVFIGFFSFCLVLLLGTAWFGVPVKGSAALLVSLSVLFLVTTLTLGIFISTVARTQLQAMQIAFAFILPSVLLSGFMFPRETMPVVIQWLGGIVPLTYFLEILRGIFLKGVGLEALWKDMIGMVVFFLLMISVAILRFRKKIE